VTAVFEDSVDIYFARQQVAERLGAAKESLPPGAEPTMGPITTGLGEVYMWTVEYEHPDGKGAATAAANEPGWQADGSYLTPEGQRLSSEVERASYLRTVQDWIIRPQLKGVEGVAGIDAIGGYVKQYHVQPDPMKLVSYGLTFHEVIEALERNNASVGAGYVERNGEAYNVRVAGRIRNADEIADVVIGTRNGTPIHIHDVATVGVGGELRTGSASENGEEVVVGTAMMLIGANSRTVAAAVDEKIEEVNKSLPPGHQGQDGAQPHQTGRRDGRDGAEEPLRRRRPCRGRAVPAAWEHPGRADHRDGDPALDAADGDGHGAGGVSGNLHVAGRDRLRPDRRRRRDHRRELPAASAERQHELGRKLTAAERRAEVFARPSR
jgi:hypothetical protein